jgi:hypothetical protein
MSVRSSGMEEPGNEPLVTYTFGGSGELRMCPVE